MGSQAQTKIAAHFDQWLSNFSGNDDLCIFEALTPLLRHEGMQNVLQHCMQILAVPKLSVLVDLVVFQVDVY